MRAGSVLLVRFVRQAWAIRGEEDNATHEKCDNIEHGVYREKAKMRLTKEWAVSRGQKIWTGSPREQKGIWLPQNFWICRQKPQKMKVVSCYFLVDRS